MRSKLALLIPALALCCLSVSGRPDPIPKSDTPIVKKDAPAPTPSPPAPVVPTLTGPDTAAYMAVFSVSGIKTGDAVVWTINPEDSTETYESVAGDTYVLGGPPAKYRIKATVVSGGVKVPLQKTVSITGGVTPLPPGPGPQPGPTPPVPPTPGPTGTPSRFVVVEDTSTGIGKWRGDILGSPKIKSFYNALQGTRTGAIHSVYDASTKLTNLSAEGQKYVGLAAGKTLPYLWILDAQGGVVKEQSVPKDPDAFIALFDTHVGPRSFGLIIEAPKLKWVEFGSTPQTPLIDRSQFPAFQSLGAFLPPTYDQDGIGQCASSAATGMYEFYRNIAGLPRVHVSAGDLYSRVNGGRDNGSTLEDNMSEMLNNGVAPVSASVPYVWSRRISYSGAGRGANKLAEVYLCKDFDAACSAILQGMPVQIGISWGSNYTPDKNGWLPRKAGGSVGGHSLYCYGVVRASDGTYGLLTRNSWSAAWGGSADGTVDAGSCIIPESAFTGYIGGFYAVRSVVSAGVTKRDPFKLERTLVAENSLAF